MLPSFMVYEPIYLFTPLEPNTEPLSKPIVIFGLDASLYSFLLSISSIFPALHPNKKRDNNTEENINFFIL